MHSIRNLLAGAAAACALGAASVALADDGPEYPEGYRLWDHVKSMIVDNGLPVLGDPANPLNVIGLHHIYANKKAMEGYRSLNAHRPGAVVFKDGSVIAFDLLEHVKLGAPEAPVAIVEGPRKLVAVMEKDARRFAKTGGWDFQVYNPVTRAPLLDAKTQQVCFGCHKNGDPALPIIGNAAASDFVFSRLRD
jgi:hypothetical protein